MARKDTRKRVLEFLEGLPLLSRSRAADDQAERYKERKQLAGVKARILEILSNDALISTGRVQILALQSLKDELGDRWETHRDFIHDSLKTILKRRLNAFDVFFQHEEEDYVIVFASVGLEAAKLICASIMRELNALLLGHEETRSITIRTAVGVVDGRLLLEETSLDEVLAGLAIVEPQASDIVLEDVDSIASAAPAGGGHEKAGSIGWEPLDYVAARNKPSYQPWTPIDEDALDEGVVPEEFKLIYRPMWSPQQEIISTFTTNFVGTDDHGQLRNAYSFVRGAKLTRAMDVDVLKRAAATTADLFDQRQRFVLAIPHHYESATNWSRLREYVEVCKTIPKDTRNYVILSCDDFPPGVPASKLQMIGYGLRPCCRGLAANISWMMRDLAPYADAGFTIVGLFIPPDTPAAAIQLRIDEFAEGGRRQGLQTALLNVHDLHSAEIARNAGVDFVMGRLIGDYQNTPGHMCRLPWSDIIQRARKAS
jgi:hypothetical protein